MQYEHFDSVSLQYVLTEVFIMKLIQFKNCNIKVKTFLEMYYNNKLSPFQQLEMMKRPDQVDEQMIQQTLQN